MFFFQARWNIVKSCTESYVLSLEDESESTSFFCRPCPYLAQPPSPD
jgi:hypothetical protein